MGHRRDLRPPMSELHHLELDHPQKTRFAAAPVSEDTNRGRNKAAVRDDRRHRIDQVGVNVRS